jgi:diaminopropionate ammonia-lyase
VIARSSVDLSTAMGLDANSRVLVIGTEGATDPELYKTLIQ